MRWFKKEVLCNPVDQTPYLIRYVVFSCARFGVYLHRFVASDWARDPHDHPKHFYVFGLWGHYTEEIMHPEYAYYAKRFGEYLTIPWVRKAPFYNHIPPSRIHRIVDPAAITWTLCFTGRHVKEWGFFPKSGYVPQQLYLDTGGEG